MSPCYMSHQYGEWLHLVDIWKGLVSGKRSSGTSILVLRRKFFGIHGKMGHGTRDWSVVVRDVSNTNAARSGVHLACVNEASRGLFSVGLSWLLRGGRFSGAYVQVQHAHVLQRMQSRLSRCFEAWPQSIGCSCIHCCRWKCIID